MYVQCTISYIIFNDYIVCRSVKLASICPLTRYLMANNVDKTPPYHQGMLDYLMIAFNCCKIKVELHPVLQEKFSQRVFHTQYQDSYSNSVLHYILVSPFTVHCKIFFIQTYFSSTDLLLPNEDGVSLLDLAVIQNEPALVVYILSESGLTIRDELMMRACRILLFFDHFALNNLFGGIYEIFSSYIYKNRSILEPIENQLRAVPSDADGIETAFKLLLDSQRCTEIARSLGALNFLKTDNKMDFYHSCILIVSNKAIPTINESMLEHVPGYLCIQSTKIMNDAYLTGRGPLSPVRSSLSFYCDWYLCSLYKLLHDDLFHLAEITVLKSLFLFVNTLSLWYGYYPKYKSMDMDQVKQSMQNFLERAGSLRLTLSSSGIPFKRYFTLINIFCLIKHCVHRNLDPDIDMEFIQFLVECGFSLNERDMFGCYPLHTLTSTIPHQRYQYKSITSILEFLLQSRAYPLSFDCYCEGNAFKLANPINRQVLEYCYPKPYSLKSLTALYFVSEYPDVVHNLNLPQEIHDLILIHSNQLPFLKIRGFDSNKIVIRHNDRFEDVCICTEVLFF